MDQGALSRAGVAGLAATLALSGCGGSSSPPGPQGMMGAGGMTGSREPGRGARPTGNQDGRALFLSAGCGSCHTLAAAGTTGTAGPNLDRARPGYRLALERIRDGAGAMPGYAGRLSQTEIERIARFVAGGAAASG